MASNGRSLAEEIAQNIRQAREQLGASTSDLAIKCGLPLKSIEDWESARIDMSSQSALLELERVAKALGVEYSALVTRRG